MYIVEAGSCFRHVGRVDLDRGMYRDDDSRKTVNGATAMVMMMVKVTTRNAKVRLQSTTYTVVC